MPASAGKMGVGGPKPVRGEPVEPRRGDAPFDKLRANGYFTTLMVVNGYFTTAVAG